MPVLDLQIVDVMIPHAKATLDVTSNKFESQTSSVCAKTVSVQDVLSPFVKLEHLLQANTAMHQEKRSSHAHSTEYSQVSRLSNFQSKLERRKAAQALMQENSSPNCITLSPHRPVKTAKKRVSGEEKAGYISALASSRACATGTGVIAAAHEDQVRQQTVDRSVLLMMLCKHLVAMALADTSFHRSNLQTSEVLYMLLTIHFCLALECAVCF